MGYGRFDEKTVRLIAGGGISDTLAASVAFNGKWGDGWIKNIAHGGKNANPFENENVMGKLYWVPTDELTVDLSASYSYVNDPTFAAIHVSPGTVPIAEGLGGLTTKEALETATTAPTIYQSAETIRATLRVNYDLGPVELVSITGYVKGALRQLREADVSPLPIQLVSGGAHSSQWSQELQIQSNNSGPLKWIAGLYYLNFKEGLGRPPYAVQIGVPSPVRPSDLLLPGATVLGFDTTNNTEGYSVFGQATYEIAQSTRVTAGLRWSHEKKFAGGDQFLYTAVPGDAGDSVPFSNGVLGTDGLIFGRFTLATRDLSETWNKPTWRLALDHDFTDDIMGYVSYSRGFKSGGFNSAPVNPAEEAVSPEIIDSFEAGVKSELFDRRLRLNMAAFLYKYRDIQVTAISGSGVARLENAAKATLYGIDVDFVAALTDRLTIRGGGSLLHSEYQEYTGAQLILPNVVGQPCATPPASITLDEAVALAGMPQSGGNCTYQFDGSGQELIIAPKFTGNVAVDYEIPFEGGSRALLTASVYHNSGYDNQPSGLFSHIDAFQMISAAATWYGPDDRYFIRLWGENLADDIHVENILPTIPSFQEVSSKPRRYGVTVGMKIGG